MSQLSFFLLVSLVVCSANALDTTLACSLHEVSQTPQLDRTWSQQVIVDPVLGGNLWINGKRFSMIVNIRLKESQASVEIQDQARDILNQKLSVVTDPSQFQLQIRADSNDNSGNAGYAEVSCRLSQ